MSEPDTDAPELPLSREQSISLLKGGMGKALMDAAALYVLPVVFIAAENRLPLILDSASAYVVDCGSGPFLVSAAHVFAGFQQYKSERTDTICLVGEQRFPLDDRLVAIDPVRDVATFRLSAEDVVQFRRMNKFPLTGSQAIWPPKPPQIGRGVFFMGFPGDGRSLRPYRGGSLVEVDWTGYTSLMVVSAINDTDVVLVLEHDQYVDIGLRPKAPEDWALGGCSGAPALTLVEHNQVQSWRLAGTIHESNSMIIKVARADCLRPDGTIEPHPDPMAYISYRNRRTEE